MKWRAAASHGGLYGLIISYHIVSFAMAPVIYACVN